MASVSQKKPRSGETSSSSLARSRTDIGLTSVTPLEEAMKLPRRTFLHLAAGAAVLPAVSRVSWAQAYPTRPITMIVPFPAGGTTDVLARIMAERMRISLGQSIVIENVTGGNGTI